MMVKNFILYVAAYGGVEHLRFEGISAASVFDVGQKVNILTTFNLQ